MKLFINKLSAETSEEVLREIFEVYGKVLLSHIVLDKTSGKSRGFAFIDMEDPLAAQKAIHELHGSEVDGRTIVVQKAIEKREPAGRDGYML
jgi:RNA recognition motif-containing protein